MIPVLLQACEPSEFLSDAMGCTFGPVTGLIGEGMFGLMLSGVLLLAFYIAGNRGLAGPSVLLILISGMAIPILPGSYAGIAWTMAFVGVAAGIVSIGSRRMLG